MTVHFTSRLLLRGVSLLALAGALASCSGGGGGGGSTASAKPEDYFGTGFGTAFRASANSEPVVPTSADVIPLSLTTEPQQTL